MRVVLQVTSVEEKCELTTLSLLGTVATWLGVISWVPSASRVWKRRSAVDLSASGMTLNGVCLFMWQAYAIAVGNVGMVTGNLVCLTCWLVTVIVKVMNVREMNRL